VVLKVKYSGGKIQEITPLLTNDTLIYASRAYAEIPRAIIAANSVDIPDSISGATVSCNAIKAAVKDAISRAR
jgi:uncharacterized protein with FMN-binding domain